MVWLASAGPIRGYPGVGVPTVQFVKSRGIAEPFDRERGPESASHATRLWRTLGEPFTRQLPYNARLRSAFVAPRRSSFPT